ncbi:HD domain-containing phosphohydrolase [Oceanithermus sp.]|uniref:GAF domain-containing protein n=1 Tax=Oceanithermus sp. TaxID=2268145 RepID=UPI00257B16A3|nr:HD domain-containing phosphohydrolase [Oceanithermus sp.]
MVAALHDAEEAFVVLRLRDDDFELVHANRAFARRTGFEPRFDQPLPGARVYADPDHRSAIVARLRTGKRCQLRLPLTLEGRPRTVHSVFFPLKPPYYAGLLRELAPEQQMVQVFRSLERVKEALDRAPAEFYAAVLTSALESVPGADAGSLWILQGDRFVCTAQVGHTPELINFSVSFETELRWYGQGEAAMRQGTPRIITRRTIEAINSETEIASLNSERTLQANLLIPIVRKGEVYGTFNLDSVRSENAFTIESIEAGRLFAEEILGFLETERREQRLRGRLDLLERIVEINRIARRARSQGQLYLETLTALRRYIGSSHVTVFLLEEDGQVLRVVASTTPDLTAGMRIPRDRGASWIAVEERRAVHIHDIYKDPRVFHFGERRRGPVALLAAPLIDGSGEVVGVISANSRPHQGFGEGELAFFEASAEAIGMATERLKALGEATRRAEAYRKLIVLSTEIEVLENPDEIAERALRTILELTPFEAGVFYTLRDGKRLEPDVLVGDYPSRFPRIYEDHPVHLGEGLVGSAIAGRKGGAVHDYRDYPGALDPFVEIGTRSILVEPLWVKGVPYGGLAVLTFGQPAAPPAEARYLVQLTARRIERAFERIGHLTTLKEAREAMFRAFGVALERRDYETRGHTERVAQLSTRLARALGLRGGELEAVRWGAYLHDIGKLAIPDRILLKEGPLDEDEWALMREHTEIGFQMLEPIPFLPESTRNIVRFHHERWDGSGYPRGLAGTEIPLEARLFAVVDVFDALANERPYKKSWPPREVARELRELSGRHLDPVIVDRFLQLKRPLRRG